MTKTEFSKILELVSIKSKDEYITDNNVVVSYEKLDGSLILVGKIEGKLITKSKTSINSDQAKLAQTIIDSDTELQFFCETEINRGRTPVFELVGPDNVIVLRYDCTELVFLGAVDDNTGEIDAVSTMEDYEYLLNTFGVKSAIPYYYTWDELLHIQETSKPNIEGFVTKTDKGLVKIKCLSYVQLHHMKDSIHNKKSLVYIILEDAVDDLLGTFRDEQDIVNEITNTQDLVSHRFNHLVIEFKELRRKYFQDFGENRKEFSLKHKNHELFSYVMKTLNSSFRDVEQIAEEQVKQHLLKVCKTQSSAEAFLASL